MRRSVEKLLGFVIIVLMVALLAFQTAAQGELDRDFIVLQLTRVQRQIEDFTADIVQEKRISLLRKEIVSHGVMKFKRPNKVFIELFDPDPSLMVVDGNSLWLYFKRERIAQRYRVAHNPMLKKYLMILDQPFTVGWEKLTSVRREGDYAVLEFNPEKSESLFSRIVLQVSTEDWLIRKLTLHEKAGDLTILSYANIRVNTGIPDSHFTLELPADVEVLQPTQP
jgi:outer membrane lipoprotein carrier protein